MQLFFRLDNGHEFEFEIEAAETVIDLKAKVAAHLGVFPGSNEGNRCPSVCVAVQPCFRLELIWPILFVAGRATIIGGATPFFSLFFFFSSIRNPLTPTCV